MEILPILRKSPLPPKQMFVFLLCASFNIIYPSPDFTNDVSAFYVPVIILFVQPKVFGTSSCALLDCLKWQQYSKIYSENHYQNTYSEKSKKTNSMTKLSVQIFFKQSWRVVHIKIGAIVNGETSKK